MRKSLDQKQTNKNSDNSDNSDNTGYLSQDCGKFFRLINLLTGKRSVQKNVY